MNIKMYIFILLKINHYSFMTKNTVVLITKKSMRQYGNIRFADHVPVVPNHCSDETAELQRKPTYQAFSFAGIFIIWVFLFCIGNIVKASVTPIPKSINDVLSTQITSVTVDGVNVQCVKDDDCKLQYAHFMFDRSVQVVVKAAQNINSYSIHPVGRGIQGTVSGNTLTFNIIPDPNKPTYLIVRINENKNEDPTKYNMGYYPLVILGDQPETNVPVPNGSSIVDITKSPYNAANDYSKDVTTSIQNAINAMSSRSGGGTVYFPAGTYRVFRQLEMKSNVAIYLAPGAHIESDPTKDYATGGSFTHPVIWLEGKQDVKFYGRGTINAKGLSIMDRLKYQDRRGIIKGPENGSTISKNIVVDGIVIRDGTTWTCDIKYADGIKISNIKVLNHWFQHYQNIKVQNDGINLCSSRNGHVWKNFVMTGDDAFCVKAQDAADGGTRACYNIKNHDNVIFNMGAGNKIGMNAKAEVYDVHFYDNEIIHCRRGIVVESTQSGSSDCCYHTLRDISFSNIRVENYRGYYDGKSMFNRYYFEFLASRSNILNVTVNNFVSETIAVDGGIAHREGSNIINGITVNCMKINGTLITNTNKSSHNIDIGSGVSNATFNDCTSVESVSTVFMDAFNTALHANYSITKLDDGTSKLQMNSATTPTHFQIYNDNGSVDNSGTNKRAYMTRTLNDFQSPYKKKLNENIANVIWTFNMRHSKTLPEGMPHVNGLLETGNNNYAQLMVLVSSNADFLASTAKGYAVTFSRDGLDTGIYRLVRFEGGLSATSNLTTLIESSSNAVFDSFWASVKVVYAPATDTWSLYLRDDGSASTWNDPLDETLVYTSIGSVVNNTFTSTEMSSFGFFANTGRERGGNNAKALYDNFGVRVGGVSTSLIPVLSRDYQIRSIQNGFAIDAKHVKVDVYNSIGILQKSANVNGSHQFVMNKPGMYILRISTAKGETSTKCLVR